MLTRIRCTALLLASLFAAACGTTSADLVLVNGKVFTADGSNPWAEALAIRGDRIAEVGPTDVVRALAGPGTRVIDLHGRVVVPGINDAHVHEPWGWPAHDVEVARDASADAVLTSIAAATKSVSAGGWIRATLPFELSDDPALTRGSLDGVAPQHAVVLSNDAGHAYLLNSEALRAFGIGDHDADPPGGRYGRDNGLLNGWLYEHAIWAKSRQATEAQSDDELLRTMRAFAAEAIRYGITSIQSMPALSESRIRKLASRTEMPVRWRWMAFQMATVNESPEMAVKYILDGTPIERGAALRTAYSDRPGQRGFINYSDEQLRRIVAVAARSNQPLLLHISGDLAIEKLFAEMDRVDVNWPAKRVRIEHGDFIEPFLADAKRLGVVVVQNPSHLMIPHIMSARLGDARANYQVLRSILDHGVPLALGSDGPPNPWLNVMFATIHPRNPAEALTREQAVIAYTRGAAYAEFAENEKGTIAPGKLADIAVLSQDIFTVPPPQLPATESLLTIVGGKVVRDAIDSQH